MRLQSKILIFVGLATAITSISLAFTVMAINYQISVGEVSNFVLEMRNKVSQSKQDALSSALLYVENIDISLGYVESDGQITILQNSGGPISGKFQIMKSLPIGSGEKLVFSKSIKKIDGHFQSLVSPVLALSLVSSCIAVFLAFLLMRKDMRSLRQLNDDSRQIAEGKASTITQRKASFEIISLARSMSIMLSRLNEAKKQLEDFLSDSSHELRTPLTVIRGYLEMLRNHSSIAEVQNARAIERAYAESLRMQKLIDDILELAELGNQPELPMEEIDFRDMVFTHLNDIFQNAPDRKYEVRINQNAPFLGSKEKMSQFFVNAFSNIAKHTPQNSFFEVLVEQNPENLKIEIQDSGPGFPSEFSQNYETMFKRFTPVRSKETGGSGLGLSIMARIMEFHGGSLGVSKSNLGGLKLVALIPASR